MIPIKDDILSARFHKSERHQERLSILGSSDMDHRGSESRRKCIFVGLAIALVSLGILGIGLCVGLQKKDPSPKKKFVPLCKPVLEDEWRIDCHPDRPISESACLARGCCFVPTSDLQVTDSDLINSSYLGVPSCYYPENYYGVGYVVTQTKWEKGALHAELERGTPSGFPGDVKRISLDVTPADDYRLRIQIRDADSVRHTPEVPEIHFPIQEERNETYNIEFTEKGHLTVNRKASGGVIFETDLSQLIFSDQFLQLTTKMDSDDIFGLSEHKEGIRKSTNWTRYTLFNQGDLPVPHRNLYGSHPFYLVMDASGKANGVFLLNSNAMDFVLQPTPAVTIRPVGGIFDFFLFLGPTPGDVVSQYSSLFGRPNFPPRWSLGFQICRYGYFNLSNTKEVLKRNLEAGIPIDVQWHDIDCMDRYLDFTYAADNFTGLPEFVDELHRNGRHYVTMISPGVSNTEKPGTYPAYDEGKKLDLFIKNTKGDDIRGKVWNDNTTVFPDFSNPAAADYWKQRFVEFHSKLDFDGVWIDMNEPLNFLNGSDEGCPDTTYDNPPYVPGRPYPLNTLTLCMSAKHHKTVHYNEHNLLAYREAKATHRAMEEITKKRPFIISRATFSGQGVYSGHWSGDITSDWDDMRYTIPAMLAFSLYGIPMTGSDICGFRLNTTEELCARWQSLGAFYPFSRNHNDYDTEAQDPAAMGETVIESTKKALAKRYMLLPYLYTLLYRNHVYGETVARPLFFEFPTDRRTYTIEDQFMLGPAVLVLPALQPGIRTIKPFLPGDFWYDFDTSSRDPKREFTADLTEINVVIRPGHILSLQEPGKTIADTEKSAFDLLVALDAKGEARGELFWDDGESLNTYDEGKYNLIKFEVKKDSDSVVFTSRAEKKGLDIAMPLRYIRIWGLDAYPVNLTINGDHRLVYAFHCRNLLQNELQFYADRIHLPGGILGDVTARWDRRKGPFSCNP